MLKKIVFSVAFCMLLSMPHVNASTLNVSVEGLDSILPNGISMTLIQFDVDGDWDFEGTLTGDNTGTLTWPRSKGLNAISPYSKFSMSIDGFGDLYSDEWTKTANQATPDLLVFALYDNNASGANLLGNGLLFTLIYPDEVTLKLKMSEIEFIDPLSQLVDLHPSAYSFGVGDNNLVFSAVPIPSAIFLLGGGICALLGVGRRKDRG